MLKTHDFLRGTQFQNYMDTQGHLVGNKHSRVPQKKKKQGKGFPLSPDL